MGEILDTSWEETVEKLKTTHTISIRQICKELKASRTWVNRYVIPCIDNIYLNSNIRAGRPSSKGGANWVLLASIALGEDYLNDSIWCNEEEYKNLIKENIIKCTKQTKRIPAELLVVDKSEYKRQYDTLTEEIEAQKLNIAKNRIVGEYIKMSKLIKARSNLYTTMLNKLGEIIEETEDISVTERGKVPAVDIEIDDFPPIKEWIAPHDIKEYGDTEESIYRKFFNEGDIRIEIALKDPVKKDLSKKVYYLNDNEPLIHKYVDEYVLVSESNYRKEYKALIEKNK